ncbi:TIGR02646 family protein [Cyclonatronum proteinivorum]|uniref:TIGR02646 family protein n=1 Tax=Cyclonatronum proteinivorum TaxID=1457365 RepID=A0A345UHS6_9BACT|nr:HNH endonuclease [Cyclonatronum proteinivorum]AXJ00028.1 TIGR02646 family protein [Cyclonatronum proteinivorum]
MRPVVKSVKDKTSGHYRPWRKAKIDLVNEIGSFCSYCEKQIDRSSLHIEHIKGQKVRNKEGGLIYDDLKFDWNNFLLACSNCNSIKSNKDIALTNPYLPHQNNLLHFIEITAAGTVGIKANVTESDLIKTKAFIDLVGLDRHPGHPHYAEFGDDRWESRLATIDIANRQLKKYKATPRETDLENIVNLAKGWGFFSVWYYQFYSHPEVLDALINGIATEAKHIIPFKGTHAGSFEAPSFNTIERNPSTQQR